MALADLLRRIEEAQRASDPERPQTARELIASMPAGGTNFLDAYRALAATPESVWALSDPAVAQWLEQTQGYNPGIVGQLTAAYQGGYRDLSDPYMQSIMQSGRTATQEELAAGYQAVAQQLASRGQLEQAVQSGFFNQFPDVDQNWLGQFIAQDQASRGGVVQDTLRDLAPITALPAAAVGGLTGAGLATGNVQNSEDLGNYAVADAAGLATGFGLSHALPALGLSTAAGEAGALPWAESALPSETVGAGELWETLGVAGGGAAGGAAAGGSAAGAAAGGGGLFGGLGTGAGIGAGLTAGGVLGAAIPAALGAVGSDRQADALRDIANQNRADRSPFLARSTEFLNNPNLYFEGPGRSSMEAVLRGLSVHGNPAGMPSSMSLAGELGTRDWLNAVTGLGNLGLSGMDSTNRLMSDAARADAGVFNSIGFGVGNALNPPTSLEQLLSQIGKSNQPSLV